MTIKYDDPILYDATDTTYDGSSVSSISINGIHGQSFVNGTDELIVAWNNHPIIRKSGYWQFQPVTLTTDTDVYFDSFLDGAFMVNYVNSNYFYNGSTWSTVTNLKDSPNAQFIKQHKTRIYLYKIKIGGAISKPSWVWFSDLPKNGQITWGLEYGTDLAQTASATVTSAGSTFKTNNIKVGDPFVITTGTNAGQYYVQSVTSETQLVLTEALTNVQNDCTFWVGGNYFEVSTDDGDYGMGLAETSDELFCFKKNSLYRYNSVSKYLRKVKTAPGTTSSRSILESGGYIYWFHPSGIYRTQGETEQVISSPIQDVIDGVESDFYGSVCAWRDDNETTVNMFLGNVTLKNGDVVRNCIARFDENAETWSLESIGTTIKVATNWLEANEPKIYAGDPTRTVYQLGTGTDHNGADIPFLTELKPIYPAGSETIVTFRRLRAYIDNGPDVQIYYKLLYKPTKKEGVWVNDENWTPMIGSQIGERYEWRFKDNARASGVILRIVESSNDESFLIKKIVLYYSDPANF